MEYQHNTGSSQEKLGEKNQINRDDVLVGEISESVHRDVAFNNWNRRDRK